MNKIDYILIVGIILLVIAAVIRIWRKRRQQLADPSGFAVKEPKVAVGETLKAGGGSAEKKASASGASKKYELRPENDLCDPITLIKTFSAPLEKRMSAIKEAGNRKMVEAVPALIEALYEPESSISVAASESLGEIGDPRAIEPLLELSRRMDMTLMREASGTPRPMLPQPEQESTQEESADASPYKFKELVVFKIDQLPREYFQADGSPIPRKELVLKGLKDNNQQMRQMAAKAAIGLDNDEIIEPLIAVLGNQYEVESVRFMAAEALGGMQDSRSVDSLLLALKDENVAVRYSAATALNGRKDDRVIDALIESINDPDRYVRSSVAYALGTTSELRAMHALFECASDDSEVVRFSAAKAVASFPVDEVMHEVSLRLEKGDRSARMSLLEILGHVKDDRAVRILKNYLANEDSELSYRASISLMAQDNPDNVDIIDELIAASKRLDAELRKIAQENVITRNDNGSNNQGQAGKTGENLLETFKDLPPNLEKLRQALLDKSPNIRGSAANTLGDFDSPDALALLAAALHDENEFVRASVVTSLGKIASEVAIEVITQAEKDSSEEVRYAIVKAVGSSRTLAGRECLGRMSTSDKSKNVKRAARLALEKLASD